MAVKKTGRRRYPKKVGAKKVRAKAARTLHARKIGTSTSRRSGKKVKIRKPVIGIGLAETRREGVRVLRVPKKRVRRTKRSSVARRRSVRARRAR